MPDRLKGLYVIIDPQATRGRGEIAVAQAALEGGARLIQLRDKQREKGLQLPLARSLQNLCQEHEALFFVNDHADLALAAGADGVHLGQKDLPTAAVRRFAGRDLLIGCSTNNAEEARRAQSDGAEYVSVGRLYETGSKTDTRPATLETLRAAKEAVSLPVCAIGGINESNIDEVVAAGADMVAVISAVIGADDVRAAARRLASSF